MISLILQIITASMTLLSVKMAGDGDQRFNWVGLANQILWILVIVRSQTYGLLILTCAMTYMYTKNLIKNGLLFK